MKTTGAAEARVPVVDLRVDRSDRHNLSASVSAWSRERRRPNHCRPVTPNRGGLRELAQSVRHARRAFDPRRDSAMERVHGERKRFLIILSYQFEREENYEIPIAKCERIIQLH